MASWKPSTVEDIQEWLAGRYVRNPTDDEYWQQLRERIRRLTPTRRRTP